MAYTATELITRSYYLSNIVAKGEETVSGEQLTDGLRMLNAFLAVKSADQRLIPYFSEQNFTAVIGQEKYFLENLISIETLTFALDTVRYGMTSRSRVDYFATPRANNINSLPYQYYADRTFNGTNLWMYFLPDKDYEFTLYGKFSLSGVTLNQDLSLTLDGFYLDYMYYGLANRICQEYAIDFPQQQAAHLKRLESTIFDTSAMDLTLSKVSTLQTKSSPDIYGMANIGHAYISP